MQCAWRGCAGAALAVLVLCIVGPGAAALKEVDSAAWTQLVKSGTDITALVLIYDDGNPQSLQAEKVIGQMESQGDVEQLVGPGVEVVKQKKGGLLSTTLNLHTFPALVLVRDGATALFTDKLDDSDAVFFWLEKAGPKAMTKVLTDDTLEHLTQASTGSTTGHWAVLFYRQSCSDHFSILESVGVNEKLWMSVAVVDLDANPKLEKRFKVTGCPELIYFRERKMYRYETKKWEVAALTTFVKSWYRNVKASPVPVEPTAFDELTEGIADYLKTQLEGENRTLTLAVLIGFAVTLVLTSVFCCLTGGSNTKAKAE